MKKLKNMKKQAKAMLGKATKVAKSSAGVVPVSVVAGLALALDPVTTLVVAGGVAVGLVSVSALKK